jgi:type VI secretion system secreted protein Hcp
MSFDAFVIFTPGDSAAAKEIKGESTDKDFGKHGAFEISEFSFGAENTLSIGSGSTGAGAGKCTFKEFTVKKLVDMGSGPLLSTLGAGGHFDKVRLFIRKSGGAAGQTGAAYLTFAFRMVAVKSIEWSGSTGDDVPSETVIFEYGAMALCYRQQDKSGALAKGGKKCTGGWSRTENVQLPDNGTSDYNLVTDDLKETP